MSRSRTFSFRSPSRRRQSSQLTHSSMARMVSASTPSAPAMAERISVRQSPYFEWVFIMPPPSFTSLPMWPMSSAPLKSSSLQISRETPIKLDTCTAVLGSIFRLSRMKSEP